MFENTITGDFLLEAVEYYIQKHPYPEGLLCKKYELLSESNNRKIEDIGKASKEIDKKIFDFESKVSSGKIKINKEITRLRSFLTSV